MPVEWRVIEDVTGVKHNPIGLDVFENRKTLIVWILEVYMTVKARFPSCRYMESCTHGGWQDIPFFFAINLDKEVPI